MKIKEIYIFGDMYENLSTLDNIEECIENAKVLHTIDEDGNKININSTYIVSYVI